MILVPHSRPLISLFIVVILAGCAVIASNRFDDMFGPAEPRQRTVAVETEEGKFYHQQVQPLIEKRCVVCHGCYDAPCQLKLSSAEGIDRGASKNKIYVGSRLRAAPTSRLFFDYATTAQWRDHNFYPVLNEHAQSPLANQQASVMSRLLKLKKKHPLPGGEILPDTFDFSLNRKQECPKPDEIDAYERDFPEWGMPFGLPGLSKTEHKTLQSWLKQGAKMAPLPPLSADHVSQVAQWEEFLNGDSLKQQLVGRYLYEHWFIAHLYFDDLPAGEFFRAVRSRTPPGEPIDIIATRRPYDDPGVQRVYYRLWRERGSIIDKTHMPYALNADRLQKYRSLFLQQDYAVTALPSYAPKVASNPFKSFEAIPTVARYKFLLEEAQFTIMNFIKGPVCRGQVALNVINDHFWVFFVTPWEQEFKEHFAFYSEEQDQLALPSAAASNAGIVTNWLKYSKLQRNYFRAKTKRMDRYFPNGEHLTTGVVWDGDGENQNASLTVFRHFDSATVLKGLVGRPPQTAWVIDYGLLERIHYLLVAGFDVYGNVGHQLNSRLYMDFLRIEGEFNFLALLPPATRISEMQQWYRDVSSRQRKALLAPHKSFVQPSGIDYKTADHKQELYAMLQQRLAAVLPDEYSLQHADVPSSHRQALDKLQAVQGSPAIALPEVTFLTVGEGDAAQQYTLLHNNAHSNVTSLFNEDKNRLPEKDTITVARGFVGAYPEAFMRVDDAQLEDYVASLLAVNNEADYTTLMARFGVRRTDPGFWQHSDALHARYRNSQPYDGGLFDYGRLENR